MGKRLFVLAWGFVLAVAAYDTGFAWHYRAVFGDWELNPLARWSADHFGVGSVLVLKGVVVAFSVVVAALCWRRRRRLTAFVYTAVVGGVHLALLVDYVLDWMQPY